MREHFQKLSELMDNAREEAALSDIDDFLVKDHERLSMSSSISVSSSSLASSIEHTGDEMSSTCSSQNDSEK